MVDRLRVRKQYWAALTSNGEILAIGITMFGRFERCCFSLSCGGYGKWVADGSCYAELLTISLKPFYTANFIGLPSFVYGLNIKDFPHGQIWHCKSAKRLY